MRSRRSTSWSCVRNRAIGTASDDFTTRADGEVVAGDDVERSLAAAHPSAVTTIISLPIRWRCDISHPARFLEDPMPGPRAQDLRLPPRNRLLERVAAQERVEVGLGFPLAHDDVAAERRDVFVQMRFDVPGHGLEHLDDGEEAFLELLFFPRLHLVMHADRGHEVIL